LRLEGLDMLKNSNDLTETRNCDLPACSIVPQPTTLPRAPKYIVFDLTNFRSLEHTEILYSVSVRKYELTRKISDTTNSPYFVHINSISHSSLTTIQNLQKSSEKIWNDLKQEVSCITRRIRRGYYNATL
jgi:hypothetical protein